jgi:hypothetical protein
MRHSDRLREILWADTVTARAMDEARAFALPDWWLVSGVIYNTVWNALTGRPSGHGIKDIDLFYWDPDTSWDAEDAVIRRGASHFASDPPVEIRNQARVHLWYESRFGRAIPPIPSSRASIADFAAETHAVGVRLDAAGDIEIEAPYGLDAIFEMRIVPNARTANRAELNAKTARQRTFWPELTVETWPEDASA